MGGRTLYSNPAVTNISEDTRMARAVLIEMHAPTCACRGGSWIAGPGRHGLTACPDGQHGLPGGAVVLPLGQWRAMGRPKDADDYKRILALLSASVTDALWQSAFPDILSAAR
jgi:hypothetical protein